MLDKLKLLVQFQPEPRIPSGLWLDGRIKTLPNKACGATCCGDPLRRGRSWQQRYSDHRELIVPICSCVLEQIINPPVCGRNCMCRGKKTTFQLQGSIFTTIIIISCCWSIPGCLEIYDANHEQFPISFTSSPLIHSLPPPPVCCLMTAKTAF